jgi:hypothetical protein
MEQEKERTLTTFLNVCIGKSSEGRNKDGAQIALFKSPVRTAL